MAPAESIFYLFVGLTLGIGITFLLSRYFTSLDYTVLVFLTGIITALSITPLQSHSYDEPLYQSILQWENIDPDLIIFAFLPVLIFGEAFTLNLHQVKKVLLAALTLAVPGALFSAWLLAHVFKYLLVYEWDWSLCWLIGVILCATDPVAVVAILKTVSSATNSHKRLTYLIILEALLNDGTALVLYDIIGSKSANQSTDVVNAFVIYSTKVLFVSPLIGLATGIGTTLFLRLLNRSMTSIDTMLQIFCTICTAYLSFFVAQSILNVSGVVSCTVAGIIISYFGQPLYVNAGALDVVWHALEWCGNTLIFLIAGLIVGTHVIDYVELADFANVFVVYLAMLIIRFVLLAICHHPIHLMIPEYSFKEAAFVSFAGLRGAVSLSLALLLVRHVENDEDNYDDLIRYPKDHIQKAIFIICGSVALTIFINGTLAKFVLRILRLIPSPSPLHHSSIMLTFVEARMRLSATRLYEQLKLQFPLLQESRLIHKWQCCSILDDAYPQINRINPLERTISEHAVGADERARENIEQNNHSNVSNDIATMADMSLELPHIPILHTSGRSSMYPVEISSPSPESVQQRRYMGSRQLPVEWAGMSIANSRITNSFPNNQSLNDQVGFVLFDGTCDEQLVLQFRTVFLQVVRLSYLQQISSGMLPRGSTAALTLLSSVDYGLETAHTPGLQDFDFLKASLSRSYTNLLLERAQSIFHDVVSARLADEIHALLSFIEAHEFAQVKIPYYLGPDEHVNTNEEMLLVNESRELVSEARKIMTENYSSEIIHRIVAMKAVAVILHGQEELITHFLEEGIISTADAQYFHSFVESDLRKFNQVTKK